MIRKYIHKTRIVKQSMPQLPRESAGNELEQLRAQLLAMEFGQVVAYAQEKEIDIGNVTTVKGAVGKIIAALEQEEGGGGDGTGA